MRWNRFLIQDYIEESFSTWSSGRGMPRSTTPGSQSRMSRMLRTRSKSFIANIHRLHGELRPCLFLTSAQSRTSRKRPKENCRDWIAGIKNFFNPNTHTLFEMSAILIYIIFIILATLGATVKTFIGVRLRNRELGQQRESWLEDCDGMDIQFYRPFEFSPIQSREVVDEETS